MIALLQRVSSASVTVEGAVVGAIDSGLLVLIGIQPADTEAKGEQLLRRVLDYRVFADADGRMNRSLREVSGGLLLVSQFTLAADTTRGLRPSFTSAAAPDIARHLFDSLLRFANSIYAPVASGVFGADMKVALVNDGPVTFWLEV
jgi:D-tyrosyl-tRNA(Tyr) deacylase